MPDLDEFSALTFIELAIQFKNNKIALIDWLKVNGMLPREMICPCGEEMRIGMCSRAIDGLTWRCPEKSCKKR